MISFATLLAVVIAAASCLNPVSALALGVAPGNPALRAVAMARKPAPHAAPCMVQADAGRVR